MTPDDINQNLADVQKDLIEILAKETRGPDHIGLAARKAAAAESEAPEYFLSDNVAQMVLLHEIIRELRHIRVILEATKP